MPTHVFCSPSSGCRNSAVVALSAGMLLAAVQGGNDDTDRAAMSSVDGHDPGILRALAAGEIVDCNSNGIHDPDDITNGTSLDCNGNVVPDECEVFPATPITSRRIASQLSEPVAVTVAPGDTDRLFIVEKIGRVRIYDIPTQTLSLVPFLDIAPSVRPISEGGLLSVAFHPNYAVNGKFYVAYNQHQTNDMRLAEYTVTANPEVADPGSEVLLKTLTNYDGHHGGQLHFGPDGYLYFSTGDGTTAGEMDFNNNAQNLQSLHGKILRIDVDNPPTYIPVTNPYVGNPGAFDEVWSFGLRNPWRFSFDRLTGDMYIGDVGKTEREEIDFQSASSTGQENYGWRCMEGVLCTGLVGCTCNDPGLTLPIHDIQHDLGDGTCAIIGGFVYRGCAMPDLGGRYFFADFCGSYIKSLVHDPTTGMVSGEVNHMADLVVGFPNPASFGEDHDGELYYTTFRGDVWEILPVADFDCNGNTISDRVDIAGGTGADCNGNGIPDECDIASATSNDCDGDTVPDECQFGTPVSLVSPTFSPVGTTTPQTHTFVSPPAARTTVTVTLRAIADLNSAHEWIDVELNGTRIGTVLQRTGNGCPAIIDTGSFTVPAATFNTLLAGGDAVIDVITSINVSMFECPASTVEVTIEYDMLDPAFDFDGNGVADACECVADTDGSTAVDVGDLLAVLADWGPCPGCPSDINNDGNVDVADLLRVLADWGSC